MRRIEAAGGVTIMAATFRSSPVHGPQVLDLTPIVVRFTLLERTYADSVLDIMEVQLQISTYSGAAQQHFPHAVPGGPVRSGSLPTKSQPCDASQVASAGLNMPSVVQVRQQTCVNSYDGSNAPRDNNDGKVCGVNVGCFQVTLLQWLHGQKQVKRSPLSATYGSGSNMMLRSGFGSIEVWYLCLNNNWSGNQEIMERHGIPNSVREG